MAEFEFGFIHKRIIPQTNIININHGSCHESMSVKNV